MKHFDENHAVILLVEDNEGDACLAMEAFSETQIKHELFHVRDGVEAMSFLKREENFADAPRPDIILLDLNMPRMDGGEVMAEMNKDPELAQIPVIVLTTSHNDRDISRCYRMNANCYITKPVDYEQFVDVIQAIEKFWFSVAALPENPAT